MRPTVALSTMNTMQFCKQNAGERGGKFGYTWNVIFAPSERYTFRAVIVANYYHGISPVSGNPGKRGAESVSKCSFGYLTRLPKLPEWKIPKKLFKTCGTAFNQICLGTNEIKTSERTFFFHL